LWAWPSNFGFDALKVIAFREGRFFGPVVAEIFRDLGSNASLTFTLSALVLMACQAATGLLVCRLWAINDDWRLSAIATSFLVLHPYQADLASWRVAQFTGGLPFVMMFWALLACTRSAKALGISVVVIVLALGIHQIPLEMAAAALVLQVPLALARGTFDRQEWIGRLGALTMGLVLYVVLANLVIAFTNHEGSIGRDKIILLSNPALVIARSRELLSMMAARDPLAGWLTRVLLAATAGLCVGQIILAKTTVLKRIVMAASLVISIVVAFLCAISLTVIPEAWVPVFRNMLSVGVIWAAIATMAFALSGDMVRRVVIAAIIPILLGFVGSNNTVLSDQQRVNRRDLSMMNRIAVDIDALANVSTVNRLLFIGTNNTPLNGIATAADLSNGWHAYGTSLSVFAVPWPGYLTQLYNELTGLRFGYGATNQEQVWAQESCRGRHWPEKGSVLGNGSLAVVCLGAPTHIERGAFDDQ